MFPGIVLSCHICSRSFLPSTFEYWKHNVLVLFAHLVPDSDRVMAFLLAWNSWWMYLHHEHWHTLQIMMFAAAAVIVGIQADVYLPVGIVLQYKSLRWGRRLGNCCRLNVLCPPRFLYLSAWAPVGGSVQRHCWISGKCSLTGRNGSPLWALKFILTSGSGPSSLPLSWPQLHSNRRQSTEQFLWLWELMMPGKE